MSSAGDTTGRRSWAQVLSKLADALVTLVRAELGSLREELRIGSSEVLRVVVLGAVAVLFGLLGLVGVLAGAVLALSLVIPPWAAAVSVGVALLLIAVVLGNLASRRLSGWEPPWQTVQRRFDEHVSWVQSELMADPAGPSPDDDYADLEPGAESEHMDTEEPEQRRERE